MVSKWVHLEGLCPSFTFHRRFPVLNYQHSGVKVGLPYSFPREPLRTVCVCNSNTASQPCWRQNNAALQSKPNTYNALDANYSSHTQLDAPYSSHAQLDAPYSSHAQLDAPYSSHAPCALLPIRHAQFQLRITVDGLYSKFPVRVVLLGHFQTRRSDMVVVTTSALHGIIFSRNRLISSLERHFPNWSYPQYP